MSSGPIQIFPPGLLGFFQIKNDGQNPKTLLEEIRPSLDMQEWYLWSGFERHTGTGTLVTDQVGARAIESAGIAAGVGLKTPSDEWWYVHSFTIMGNATTSVAAADLVEMAPMCNVQASSGAFIWLLPHTPYPQSFAAGSEKGAAIGTTRGFFMPPGSELMVYVMQVVAATSIATRGDALITRLPI